MNAAAEIISSSDLTSQPSDRDARGRQIAATRQIKRIGHKWAVPSQTGSTSAYIVDLVDERCSCKDWELRRQPCKHVHATYYWVAWGRDVDANGTVTETVTVKVKRKTVKRDWAVYNAGQFNEGLYVERLLRTLCDGIDEPARKPGCGRKPVPLKDATFAAVMKVYSQKSQRRVQSDLADSVAKGTLDQVSNYNVISKFLGNEASTALLVSLIEESAKPLAIIEKGQFAIDSTGFSTATYDRYFSYRHQNVQSTHKWTKLHIAVGTVTHAITGVKVSDAADCPQLPELLAQTRKNFAVREVSADKAYSSKNNHEVLDSFGVEAYIPFRENAVIDLKREVWSRQLCEFLFNKDKFLPHYHRRSNVETVNWMIKSKFGSSVDSKTPTAQANEVLCKCLLHNLACIVHAIFAAGLAPRFWQDAPAATGQSKLTLVPMPEN